MPERWTVGEAARATGLTVRTLHHYEACGLVRPSGRTGAGHRRNGPREIARLERVAALRRAGLGLDEIAAIFASGDVRPALERRLAELDEEVAAAARLRRKLIDALKEVTMIEEKLAERRKAVGDDRIREVQREWGRLFAALERHRAEGTDPADPAVQALAARGDGLLAEFHGGDPDLIAHARRAWRENDPADVSRGMVDAALWDYYQLVQSTRRT